jgi:ATP-dependent DNA helicase RecG
MEKITMNFGKESESIEFKKSTSLIKEGIISLVAMLNKTGKAYLYFGVDDNGELVGQEIGKDTLREISQRITESVHPQIIPRISLLEEKGKKAISIIVEGNNMPYSCGDKYYIRVADSDRILKPEELKEFFSFKYDFDSVIKIESKYKFLKFNQLKSLFLMRGMTLKEETFKNNLHLLTSEGKYNLLAELVADENDVSIKVAKFSGRDKTDLIVRNEFGNKCLFLASEQVLQYCEAINETKIELEGRIHRKETKLFHFDALREAWLNAIVHNRWTRKVPPAIYIFSDRIEVVSIGGLPLNMNKQEFFSGKSYPINPELQKIFGQLDMVEQTGHGVPLIVDKYGEKAFDISDNFITVTIPFSHFQEEKKRDEIFLTSKQKDIVSEIKENPKTTSSQLALKLKISEASVRHNIQALKDMGMLFRQGANKNGYWKVNIS